MTPRWSSVIAACAFAALICALGSVAPWAGEQEQPQSLAAGPQESASPGATDAAPDASPSSDSATKADSYEPAPDAKPAAEKSEETPAPAAEETSESKDSDPDPEPAEKAEESAAGPDGQAGSAAETEVADDKAKASDAQAQGSGANSAAAAKEVKAGDIPVPTDAVAVTAFNVLDKHCARCHQAGPTLKRRKPAKNFGNVLHLEQISAEPSLILPGNPDGSKLFIQIAKKEMPYDCYQEFDCKVEPTEEEVRAIYDWIKSLGEFAIAACAGRKLIDEEAIVTVIAADLEAQPDHRRRGMR